MPLIIADRVLETSLTSGTGSFQLNGAKPGGFQAYGDVCPNNALTFYTADDHIGNWEDGMGVWTTGGHLSRMPYDSSNGGSLVNFPGASIDIFLDLTAQYFLNPTGRKFRNFTGSETLNLGLTDDIVYINKDTPSPTSAIFPRDPNSSLPPGMCYTVLLVDQALNCEDNPITVTDPDGLLINGQSEFVMNINGQSNQFSRNSTGWSILI